MAPTRLRIAIFNADVPVPKVLATRGQYSDIFEGLLRVAAASLPEWKETDAVLDFPAYDVITGPLPTEEELLQLDGIIITGGIASAYDPDPWILRLDEFLHYTYHQHQHIRFFGACFGHQILCQALLTPSPLPSCVTLDPKGWEIGLHAITLSSPFMERFGSCPNNQLRLQFVHHDHVDFSPSPSSASSLPPGWQNIGSTPHCHLQGVYQPGRVLTYQAHFEFDEFVTTESLRFFGPNFGWDAQKIGEVIKTCEGESDAPRAAEFVMRFFVEDSADVKNGADKVAVLEGCSSEVENLESEEGKPYAAMQRA